MCDLVIFTFNNAFYLIIDLFHLQHPILVPLTLLLDMLKFKKFYFRQQKEKKKYSYSLYSL